MLTSLAIHSIPMTLTTHIRWYTIPEQLGLPLDEQRFAPLADTSDWSGFLENFFMWPFLIYFCWLICYAVINFLLTDKVADYTHESCYKTFTNNPKIKGMFSVPLPLVFLATHFAYYLVLHCFAMISYHCYWVNVSVCIFFLLMSFYQGANFYMEYFSRKYEVQLSKLAALEEEVASTPQGLKRQASMSAPSETNKKVQ